MGLPRFYTRRIHGLEGTSSDLRLDGADATLTVGPGNNLKLNAQAARNLAAHLEETADAVEEFEREAAEAAGR